MSKNILKLAVPMTLAQLINLLYNIVDRMYIGRIPNSSTLALTGVGITFPIIIIINAFANLFGMGGAPLCSIARGKGDNQKAEHILGNSFCMLIGSGLILTVLILIFKTQILYMFGASDTTFNYADSYITIYLYGTVFVMVGLGMNNFINSQGFGKIGMTTIILGAVSNIILDPIFIFAFNMGVKGAAIATVISQMLSAIWVLIFLTGKNAILKLKINNLKLNLNIVKEIVSLGMSGFIMSITNSAVQIICNASLQIYGGDIYIGIMTVINSVREIFGMPVNGLTSGAQPVLGYNYGANEYKRVREGIKFMSISCISYTFVAWIILMAFPSMFIHMFNSDTELIILGIPSVRVYFLGFFMMSLQFSGQSTFIALGMSKQAIFFSLLRKAFIVIPLTLILPKLFNLGIWGIFLAEPISNFIGGTASFLTMLKTVMTKLK